MAKLKAQTYLQTGVKQSSQHSITTSDRQIAGKPLIFFKRAYQTQALAIMWVNTLKWACSVDQTLNPKPKGALS